MRINEPIAYILLYAAMYAAFGVASPFWPKFFETRGLTSLQIGFILAAAHGSAPCRWPNGWEICRCYEIIAPCARDLRCLGSRNGRRIVAGK